MPDWNGDLRPLPGRPTLITAARGSLRTAAGSGLRRAPALSPIEHAQCARLRSSFGWLPTLLHSVYNQPDAAAVHAQ